MGSAKEYRKFSFRERIYCLLTILGASQVALVVKNAPANAGDTRDTGSIPWVGNPWRRKWQPTPVFLPRKFCGRRFWWATVYGVAKIHTPSMHTDSTKANFTVKS